MNLSKEELLFELRLMDAKILGLHLRLNKMENALASIKIYSEKLDEKHIFHGQR